MRRIDWLDTLVVIGWVGVWSFMAYVLPYIAN